MRLANTEPFCALFASRFLGYSDKTGEGGFFMIPDIGTRVVYGTSGVCTVVDMREEDFGAGKRIYYVLRPLAKHSVSTDIFVPADNERLLAKIKNVLTPKEIYELIEIIPEEHMDWIDDNRARSIKFESVISEGDRHELVAQTKATYNRKHELSKQGKKLSITDERFMRAAKKMLFEEFAIALEIEQEDVIPFITKQIKCREKKMSEKAD